jgi:hypothetical protein
MRSWVRVFGVCLLLAVGTACPDRQTQGPHKGQAPKQPERTPHKQTAARPALHTNWNPATGRGHVLQVLANGDRLRTAFHIGYKGYTGGLVIGSFSGSGYGMAPARPIRGFKTINLFCAQDESIWDHGKGVELTYGWSENYGSGPDGERLDLVKGEVIERGPRRIVLRSRNAGGCYEVTKVAYTRLDVPWWIIATRIVNICRHPVRFDLFSGDDPWIGLYRSSDGDVGWTPEGLVRRETAFGIGRFTAGGFYDLGNQALGQQEGSFSNQANFLLLDPAVPLPDLTLFANRFAHHRKEIDPRRPLDNKSLTALNMGWRRQRLLPGQALTVAFALGRARTRRPGEIPTLPEIEPADWSVWRQQMPETEGTGVAFVAERVTLSLSPGSLHVRGTYYLHNHKRAAMGVRILYPVLTGADRPAPDTLRVDGKPVAVTQANGRAESHFVVQLPPLGLGRFVVEYTQAHRGRQAGYMVTSALRWRSRIERAVFEVRHPRSMGRVKLSYRPDHTRTIGDQVVHTVVRQPFIPDRELTLRW